MKMYRIIKHMHKYSRNRKNIYSENCVGSLFTRTKTEKQVSGDQYGLISIRTALQDMANKNDHN